MEPTPLRLPTSFPHVIGFADAMRAPMDDEAAFGAIQSVAASGLAQPSLDAINEARSYYFVPRWIGYFVRDDHPYVTDGANVVVLGNTDLFEPIACELDSHPPVAGIFASCGIPESVLIHDRRTEETHLIEYPLAFSALRQLNDDRP